MRFSISNTFQIILVRCFNQFPPLKFSLNFIYPETPNLQQLQCVFYEILVKDDKGRKRRQHCTITQIDP